MACGDTYAALVVTTGGLTLAKPLSGFGTFASSGDYDQWHALADTLTLAAIERFDELGRVECIATGGTGCATDSATGGSYPRWNALVEDRNALAAAGDALPSSWLTFDYAGNIAAAQEVIRDALCLMERADGGIRAYGGTVPETPGLRPPAAPGMFGALLGGSLLVPALVVGGLILVARNRSRRR